ncbi:MAG: siderophore-interacting protein [Pseudomonadota bacterium]
MVAISETVVPVSDAKTVLSYFADHMRKDHGIELDVAEDGSRHLDMEGFCIDMRVDPRGLYIRIEGPNEGTLIFFKEDVAEHVSEIDATAAANIRWSGESSVEGALPVNFKVLKVVSSRPVFPGLQRVTLAHDDVSSLAADGVHLRLMLPLITGRVPKWPRMAANGAPVWPQGDDKLHARIITLRNVRPTLGEVDVDVVKHEGGMISRWAANAESGNAVGIMGPAGKTSPIVSKNMFFAADGTGLPALARIIDDLPNDAAGDVVVAVHQDYNVTDYLPPSGFRVHTIAPDRFPSEILGTARELTRRGYTSYAFFAGEFDNAQEMRKHFKDELGLDKQTQLSAAYWRQGVPGYGS